MVCDRFNDYHDKKQNKMLDENLILFHPVSNFDSKCPITFHPKLYLIKFENHIRVIIGTGNILSNDWEAYGNIFFSQDYPIKRRRYDKGYNRDFAVYLKAYI